MRPKAAILVLTLLVNCANFACAGCGCLKCSKDLQVLNPLAPVKLIVKKPELAVLPAVQPSAVPFSLSLLPKLPVLPAALLKAASADSATLTLNALQSALLNCGPQPAAIPYKIEVPILPKPATGPICTDLMAGPDRIVMKHSEMPKFPHFAYSCPPPNLEQIILPCYSSEDVSVQTRYACSCGSGYDDDNMRDLARRKRHLRRRNPTNLLTAPFQLFLRIIPNLLNQFLRLLTGMGLHDRGGGRGRVALPHRGRYVEEPRRMVNMAPKALLIDRLRRINELSDYHRKKRSLEDLTSAYFEIDDDAFKRLLKESETSLDSYETSDSDDEDGEGGLLQSFNLAHILPHTPLFYFLNSPIRFFNHLDHLSSHLKPILTTVPFVIKASRNYFKSLRREFQDNMLNIFSNLIGNFDDLTPINPMNPLVPQSFKRRKRETDWEEPNANNEIEELFWEMPNESILQLVDDDSRIFKKKSKEKAVSPHSLVSALFPHFIKQLSKPPSIQEIYKGKFESMSSYALSSTGTPSMRRKTSSGPVKAVEQSTQMSTELGSFFEVCKVFGEKIKQQEEDAETEQTKKIEEHLNNIEKIMTSSNNTSGDLSTLSAFLTAQDTKSSVVAKPQNESPESSESTSTPIRSKRYIIKVVDEDEISDYLKEKLKGLQTYTEGSLKSTSENISKRSLLRRLSPKLVVDKSGNTFIEVNGMKKPLLKGKKSREAKTDVKNKITELIQQAKALSNHELVSASTSSQSYVPSQVIRDKLTQTLSNIQTLIKEDLVSKNEDLYQDLLKLQNLKQLVTQKWKNILSKKDCNNLDEKIAILNDLHNIQTLKDTTSERLYQTLKPNRTYMTKNHIRTLLRIHKLQCIINRIIDDFSDKIKTRQPFDPKCEQKYVSHLETVWFVDGTTRSGVLANLKDEHDRELRQQTKLMEDLRHLLRLSASEDARDMQLIGEAARMLWEMDNLEKLQDDALADLQAKLGTGANLRKELKILFDLQVQMDKALAKQEDVLKGLDLARGNASKSHGVGRGRRVRVVAANRKVK